jgi:hypothetical protein
MSCEQVVSLKAGTPNRPPRIIDSQSVVSGPSSPTPWPAVRGKRHGRVVAGPRRREGDSLLSTYLSTPMPFMFADQGFAGRLVDWAAGILNDGRDRLQAARTTRLRRAP